MQQDRQAGNLLPEILQQDGHGEVLLHGKVRRVVIQARSKLILSQQDEQVDGLLHETLQQNGHGEPVLHEKVQSIGNKEDEMDGVGQHDEDLK